MKERIKITIDNLTPICFLKESCYQKKLLDLLCSGEGYRIWARGNRNNINCKQFRTGQGPCSSWRMMKELLKTKMNKPNWKWFIILEDFHTLYNYNKSFEPKKLPKSGYKGIYKKEYGFAVNVKGIHIGTYKTLEEALEKQKEYISLKV